jgi:hypothetical protein
VHCYIPAQIKLVEPAIIARWNWRTGAFLRQLEELLKMAAAYEDNFGFWHLDDPEVRAFFEHVRRQSVRTICKRCGETVRLMPPKILCAVCVSALECGAPISLSRYGSSQPRVVKARVKAARKRGTIARLAGGEPRLGRTAGDDAVKTDRIVGPGQ